MYEMCGYGFVFLTEDVLTEILSRLPVKSLLRFKCVSKKWKALIENPTFVAMNYRNSNCNLLVQYNPPSKVVSNFVLFPDLKLDNTPPVYEELYTRLPVSGKNVFGPVDGLFLVHISALKDIEESLALWNPATREWNPLPLPEHLLPAPYRPLLHTFGFGLDPSTKDYKIIWFRCFINKETETFYAGKIVVVYTLRSNTWRYIDFPLDCSFMDSHDINMKGICYWGMRKEHGGLSILSFDMEKEVFCEILAPKGLQRERPSKLALCGHLLAIFASEYDSSCCQCSIDVWILRDDEHWIKHLSLGPFPEPYCCHRFWRSNEILFDLYWSGRMILYNTDNGESKDLGIQGVPKNGLFYSFCYKESLYSSRTMQHGLKNVG